MNRTFNIQFRESTHFVQVVIHSSRTALRRCRTRLSGGKEHGKQCDGFCWQGAKPYDGLVASIHLARGYLIPEIIAHESFHAGFHRAVLVGIPKDLLDFEEWVATDTGVLTQKIVDYLTQNRIKLDQPRES